MINRLNYSVPSYTNNKCAFKASPQEIAKKAMKVDPQEPDEIEDFADEIDKESAEKLRQAASEIRKKQPDHWAAIWLEKNPNCGEK